MIIKKTLLTSAALFALAMPHTAFAQCATTGVLAANCALQADTTGNITVNNGVFVTIGADVTIGHTVDGAAASNGVVLTDGMGRTVTQTGSLGGGANFLRGFVLGDTDIWTAQNNITVSGGGGVLAIGGGTSGVLNVDSSATGVAITNIDTNIAIGAGATVNVTDATNAVSFNTNVDMTIGAGGTFNINDATGGVDFMIFGTDITVGDGGAFNINDSTGAVNTNGANFGLGAGATLNLADTNNLTMTGTINGIGAGQGILTIGEVFTTQGLIGTTNALELINANANFIVAHNVTATDLSLADGATIFMGAGGTTLNANITGSSGVNTLNISGVDVLGAAGNAIDLGAGNDLVDFNAAGFITAATLDGGAGTDSIEIDGANVGISADISNFENININTANMLTQTGGVSGGAINMNAAGSNFTFNAVGKEVSAAINGGAGLQTVVLSNGDVSGAIDLGDGGDSLVTNGGTLSGTLDMGAGADTLTMVAGNLVTGGTWSNLETINNTGGGILTINHAITGVDDADNTGLDVDGGLVIIAAGGSVDGAIHSSNGSGTGTLGVTGTASTGGIIEDVALSVTGGTFTVNHILGANSALGAVSTSAGATAVLNANVTSGAALTNTGTTRIGAGSTLNVGDHTAAAGTFIFDIDTTTSFGVLAVGGGNNVDLTGATVQANVLSGALTNGDELLIGGGAAQVTGLGGGAGQTATTITDNSFLWGFALADGSQAEVTGSGDNKLLYLVVSQANSVAASSTTSGNANAGTVIQSLAGTTDTQLAQIVTNMNGAGSREALNEVLESVQPAADGGYVFAALDVSQQSLKISNQRLAALRADGQTGMAAGDKASGGERAWTQAFGQAAEQDKRDGIDGFDADTYGVAFGIDTENLHDDAIVGVAVSYADTEVDSENANRTNTEIQSYQVTLYGDYDLSERTYISGSLGYAHNENETTRHDVGGAGGPTANGEFDSGQITVQVETGRSYKQGKTTLTPHISANYVYYDAEDYTETGASGANLRVDNESLQMLEFGIGVDASWGHQTADGSIIVPELHVGYRYDVIGDKVQSTSSFTGGGGSFKTEGFDPAQSTFNAGAGVTLHTTDNWELTANYDFEYKSDYDTHSGFLRAAYGF